ncbi:helix-turn-helix transcriptional regulator [Amycolatopsis sp. CM201R]|nr:helix-turn-helix transcriptional regulator [Amycolatopsis sp. 505]MDS0149225.1 helix-turn-helix transcriptional regulator [Amycolatopsis sp. CM201R]
MYELRDAHGLSQDQVAAAAGISRWSLSRLELGKTTPTSLALVAALADVLGGDRAELARRALRDFERREGAEPT